MLKPLSDLKYLYFPLLNTVRYLKSIKYAGKDRYCPVCKLGSKRFFHSGTNNRPDARCMRCGSLERHRLVWRFFEKKTDLFKNKTKKLLHVAPESVFVRLLSKKLGRNYLTADLYDPRAMVTMDITDIKYPDEVFDIIYCSHVLEHVVDDKKALSEFFRVLKMGGWAVLLVPIVGEKTFEDFTITDPDEKTRLFGQSDHVRNYGLDYLDRLIEAGFDVEVFSPETIFNSEELLHMGINKAAGDIYYCKKIG